MKNYLLRFVFFLSFFCGSQLLDAQCTISHNGGLNSNQSGSDVPIGTVQGQTFIACQSGNITSISFNLNVNQTAGTSHLFGLGASATPPTTCILGTPLETFSTTNGSQTATITLFSPFPVTAGQTYAFEYSSGSVALSTEFASTGTYTDGNQYFSSSCPTISLDQPSRDLNFSVQISPATSSPAEVPTLSQWGLLILALMLMTLGTVYLLQPNWKEGLNRNS